MCFLFSPLHHSGANRTVAFNFIYLPRPAFRLLGLWKYLQHIFLEQRLEVPCSSSILSFHVVFPLFGRLLARHSTGGPVFTSKFFSFALDKGYTWLPSVIGQNGFQKYRPVPSSCPCQVDLHLSVVFLYFLVSVCVMSGFIVKPYF